MALVGNQNLLFFRPKSKYEYIVCWLSKCYVLGFGFLVVDVMIGVGFAFF